MVWSLPLLPLAAGALVWLRQPLRASTEREPPQPVPRRIVGAGAAAVLTATLALGVWAALTRPAAVHLWGAGLALHARVEATSAVMVVLVPAVALPVVVYAAAHEDAGLDRLVALLLAFVGAMLLLVVADDLLTLLVGWELVGAASYLLIGHAWWQADKPAAAAHAFNATRFGDLGLFLAAGAAFAATGSLRFDQLPLVDGPWRHAVAAGIVLAAASKSAQLPFSPWLYSAMGGPTPVSALLHAATMVAAGAYLLARLAHPLATIGWFGPVVVAVGLSTALAGGVAAALQPHAKKLLAASTSAHHGLMFAAIGAGFPAVGIAHLVTHAASKALLFLAAGSAATATGSEQLARMRAGATLPTTAALSAVGALALAGVPPLGAAWSKERVVSALGHDWPALVVVGVAAGGLSAFYAARFQLLAFGRDGGPRDANDARRPSRAEVAALAMLAGFTVLLGLLWTPRGRRLVARWLGDVPPTTVGEVALSLGAVAVGLYAAWHLHRHGRLAGMVTAPVAAAAADWFALPLLTQRVVVTPLRRSAAALAAVDSRGIDRAVDAAAGAAHRLSAWSSALDRRVVDAGVRAAAALTAWLSRVSASLAETGVDGVVRLVAAGLGRAGSQARRLQTGMVHHYYVVAVVGLVVVLAVLLTAG